MRLCKLIISGVLALILLNSSTHILHPAVGETAPEIVLNNPEGKTIKLSSLRGKLVLIDFWASWCRSCRLENHNLKKVYSKYRDSSFVSGEGFEIYSVSLDTDLSLWKQAITNDKLNWKAQVSDLKKWDSPVVADYNFKFLPHNLLIDKNGKVLAKNLYKEKIFEYLESELAH